MHPSLKLINKFFDVPTFQSFVSKNLTTSSSSSLGSMIEDTISPPLLPSMPNVIHNKTVSSCLNVYISETHASMLTFFPVSKFSNNFRFYAAIFFVLAQKIDRN